MMRFLRAASVAIFWACAANATTLVAVWSPTELLLGADSIAVTSLANGRRVDTACKIASQDASVFAFSGLVDDRITGYRADWLAQQAMSMHGTVEQRLKRFVELASVPLARSVALVRLDSPKQYEYLKHGHPVLQAIFASARPGPPSLAVAAFELTADGELTPSVRMIAKGDDGQGPRIIYAGQQARIREYLHYHRDWYTGRASDIVRTLIGLEIADSTGEVGGPVDIVKLTSSGAEWVQLKAQCAASDSATSPVW